MENIFKTTVETPIGYLELTTNQYYLLSVEFIANFNQSSVYQPDVLKESVSQIDEYFKGLRKEFNLNVQPAGTDFQNKIWEQVKKVPFGKTVSYLEIARQTGSRNNTRAVGLANGKNPIPIIIPCHRVIGVNGKLTGYAGGLEKKRWLLQHEQNYSGNSDRLF